MSPDPPGAPPASERRRAAQVRGIGFLRADRFLFAIGLDGPLVDARCTITHGFSVFAEGSPQHLVAGPAQVAEAADSRRMHGRQGLRTHAEQFLDRQSIEDFAHIVRADTAHAIGLVEVGGYFRQQFVRRDPHRRGEAGQPGMRRRISPPIDSALPCSCRLEVTSRKASSKDRPSTRGVNFAKYPKHLFRYCLVARHAGVHTDCLGTAAQRLAHGHGRAYAIAPHRIVGRSDHAASADAADDQGLAFSSGRSCSSTDA